MKMHETVRSAAPRPSSTKQVTVQRWSVWLVPVLSITCVILLVTLILIIVGGCGGEKTDLYGRNISGSEGPSGRSPQCPPSWIAVQRKCYFFSEEKTTHDESIKNCAENVSALATVTEREETLQRLIRITGQKFWIGLINTKANIPGKWEGRWADGTKVVINKTDTEGSCALMGSVLSLENRYTEHRWICERNMTE